MKRVTILVDDVDETDGNERRLAGVRDPEYGLDVWVAADRIISVEDHVEPLPTEPGARFWARRRDDAPQWWFVRTIRSSIYYVPARDESAVRIDEAYSASLVRLPDPKPTDGDAR